MTAPTPDVAFRERRTDRLVIRRFRAEDAATLAAYRSDPAVARYQSWDIPFSHEQAHSFIESLDTAHPDTPGEWFQFAVVEDLDRMRSGGEPEGSLPVLAAGVGQPRPERGPVHAYIGASAECWRGFTARALTLSGEQAG
jgi:hypothetical protein